MTDQYCNSMQPVLSEIRMHRAILGSLWSFATWLYNDASTMLSRSALIGMSGDQGSFE